MARDEIPEELATDVLAKCARYCCVRRRRRPLYVQVHHIIPRSEGGLSDDPDNLMAVCITCHIDVHTKAPFTRRFSAAELRHLRDETYRMVVEGLLFRDEIELRPVLQVARSLVEPKAQVRVDLSELAIALLLDAARSDSSILLAEDFSGASITIARNGKDLTRRELAEHRHAVTELEGRGLIELINGDRHSTVHRLTHTGYVCADELESAGGSLPSE